jgi:AAA15 family ATPase/GTPase
MLIEFSVKNFGPIKDMQTLSMVASSDTELEDYYVYEVGNLRLLKMAVLYGPNASGKTTVLKALDFLRNLVLIPTLQKSEKLNFTPFLFDENSKHEPSLIRLIFLQEGIKYDYEITFTQDYVLTEKLYYYPKGRQSEFFSRETDTKNEVSSTNWGSKVKISNRDKIILEGNTLWNEPVLAAFNKSNIQSEELMIIKNWFEAYLQMTVLPNTNMHGFANRVQDKSINNKSMMIDFIQKADVQISNIEITTEETSIDANEIELIPNNDLQHTKEGIVIKTDNRLKLPVSNMTQTRKQLFFHHKTKNVDGVISEYVLPWDLESHGTIQYYGLTALLTVLVKGKILNPIDEIETSLHPDLMKHFILTFLANAKQSQLIITTHNLSFLEEKDILRKDAIWFTQKREDGSTELYSLADFDSSVFRKNASIINAYKIGKLGAKPNLGSIFIQAE